MAPQLTIYRRRHTASHLATAAFEAGCVRYGARVRVEDRDVPHEDDLAVMWSINWPGVIADCEQRGRPYLVMERGFFADPERYISIGYNGLKGRADFCTDDVSPDRWEEIGAPLMQPWRRGSGAILVMGQVGADSAVRGTDIRAWAASAVWTAKALLPRGEVVYRPHPLSAQMPIDGVEMSTLPLADDLARARCVVTYNSNSGVDAILAGVPTIALDEGSMVWDVAAHEVSLWSLTRQPEPDREEWGRRMGYCQWTLPEIAAGDAWAHLKDGLCAESDDGACRRAG